MRECGEDDAKGMVSNIEGVRSLGGRKMLRSIRDGICVCVVVVVVMMVVAMGNGVGGGGGVDCSDGGDGGGGVDSSGGNSALVMVVRVACIGVVGVLEVLYIGVLEVDCVGVVDILVLGAVFVVEVVEGVELAVGCVLRHVVRLILWCVNGRGYFFRCFSLKLVEMNGLSVGRSLFGMVVRVDCLILLEWSFLDKMVGVDVLLDVVVVEVVVVETVDVVQVWFFQNFRRGCLGDMMGVRAAVEVVVGVLTEIHIWVKVWVGAWEGVMA